MISHLSDASLCLYLSPSSRCPLNSVPYSHIMSGFDRNQVYVVPVHPANRSQNNEKPSETLDQLKRFLVDYRIGQEYIYRYERTRDL